MARSSLFRSLKRSIKIQVEASKRGTSAEALLEKIEEARFTRRQFLGTTIAAAGMLTLPPLLRTSWAENEKGSDPVVILGAGYAGLTAAYRLAQAQVPFVVYEAAPRFGGRVFTQDKFNKEGMFCELGGELIDSGHSAIIELAGELGVPLDDFTDYDAAVEKVAYEYQGAFYTEKDFVREVRPLVAAVVRDQKTIYGDAGKGAVTWDNPYNAKRFDQMSLDEYLNSVTELPKWVRETVRHAYVGEYGLEGGRQSALNLILLIGTDLEAFNIFGESDESKRIRGGNSRLSEALAAKAGITTGKDSARIQYRHSLVAWKAKGGMQVLSFATGGGRTKEVKASQVICTVPFSRLREVDGIAGLGLSERKLRAIRSMTYGTNSKLMIGFSGRTWRKASGMTAATNGSLYSDRVQSLWDTSRLQAGNSGIITNYTGGEIGMRASKRDAEAVAGTVDRFYPGARAIWDRKAMAFMHWAKNPFTKGSFSCPGPGHYTDFFGAIGGEELNGRVQFAGEHCSVESQAFMNGSVETGSAAAERVIAARGKKRESA